MRLIVQWFTVALVFSSVTGASAQPPASAGSAAGPSPSALEQARTLRKQGMALQDNGEYESARNVYLAAWKLEQKPAVMANLATVELMLKRYRDAAEHCAVALRLLPAGADSKDSVGLKDDCETATRHVGAITVAVDQPGAEVSLNGRSVGNSPLVDPVFVDPGLAVLEAHLGERHSQRYEMDVAAGSAVRLNISIPAEKPIAQVLPAPQHEDPISRYDHVVGQPPRSHILVPALIGGGLTLAGIAVGVGFAAKASSADNDANHLVSSLPGQNPCSSGPTSNSPACQSARSSENDRTTFTNISTVGYIGAGVAAAATLVYVVFARPKSSQLAVTPVIGPTQAHFVLQSSF